MKHLENPEGDTMSENLWYYDCWGGPVGLFAALPTNMRQVKVKLIDSLTSTGRTTNTLSEKNILSIPEHQF